MEYVIRVNAGDDIEEIARKHRTTVERIKRDNQTDFLTEGMRVLIKKRDNEYVVKPYDSLESIAKEHGVDTEQLKKLNGISAVFLGQIIELP